MARVKVVLTEDVEKIGRVGDVVTVRGGYGRNYLIPQGMAMAATKANLAQVESRRGIFEAAAAKHQSDAAELATRIASLSTTISKKVGEAETLYGAVTNAEIAEVLEKEGVVVDKRRILMSEPIKALGVYKVSIRLHPEVTAELEVAVVADSAS